jgi:TP53 regulating kinase-like protein
MENIIQVGAEATISKIEFEKNQAILKKRNSKNYRDKELDEKIIKRRTKSEAKILKELNGVVNVPKVLMVDENKGELIIEYIDGKKLKEVIEKEKYLCKLAGREIKKIHNKGIIHGDLTTSNMIYKNKKIYFIDFGLGYFSKKIEDRAVDLVVFKKTFNATHSKLKNGFDDVLNAYKPDKELKERIEKIEKRARYH